ncbi:S-adenosylmethionine decarboxylase [Amylostereum chailletii]|nr:S-adenosylmethionine decarboxylase [Amylostereum chailletii]
MTEDNDAAASSAPFEGPEKLLEIWFAPSPAHIPDASSTPDGRFGLRKIPRSVWEDMLAIVKCQVLSVIEGSDMDAYLLSESSFFVSPHRLILKTCGTTLNLLGLPRILDIAREQAALPSVYRCFYSRKAFFFPERQKGPHREWKDEVEFLDGIFHNGAAYTVGKVNGDHWLLYITGPPDDTGLSSPAVPPSILSDSDHHPPPESPTTRLSEGISIPPQHGVDHTIEILMTQLSPEASGHFIFGEEEHPDTTPASRAEALSSAIGISDIFPPHLTTLDPYAFSPCGYSSNALIKWGDTSPAACAPGMTGEGYYTIHVTPEDGWSYASFECNVPLPAAHADADATEQRIPDMRTLVRRVVDIFRPARLSLTLFVSSADNDEAEEERGESAIEAAQRAFRGALTSRAAGSNGRLYKRTDKINYEFGDYDLAFASFELMT